MNLQLPPTVEAQLRKLAQAAGVELEAFVVHLLSDRAGEPDGEAMASTQFTAAERRQFFSNFANRHPQRTTLADDSRESIYADRGT